MDTEPFGEYCFGNGIKIYHPLPQQPFVERAATIYHEVAHMAFAVSAPFGLFQNLIARLAESRAHSESWRNGCKAVLKLSIDASHIVYESSAVLLEATMALRHSGSDNPYKYRARGLTDQAVSMARPLERFLYKSKLPTGVCEDVIHAICVTALSTTILEDVGAFHPAEEKAMRKYLRVADNNPNLRLKAMIENSPLALALGERVLAQMKARHGHNIDLMHHLYIDCTASERRAALSEVQTDALEFLKDSLSMPIADDAAMHKNFLILVAAWRHEHSSASGKFPWMGTLFPSDEEARHPDEFVLNRLDYCPSPTLSTHLTRATPVGPHDVEPLLIRLAGPRERFYLHIRGRTTEGARADSESLTLYFRVFREGTKGVRNPLHPEGELGEVTPCSLKVEPQVVQALLRHGISRTCVLSTTEEVYRRTVRDTYLRRLLAAVTPPIVILPSSSTLRHWRKIVSRSQDSEGWHAVYTRQLGPEEDTMDMCLLVPKHRRFVYARPTVVQVYETLVNEHSNITRIRGSDLAGGALPKEWWTRAMLACSHYYFFGY